MMLGLGDWSIAAAFWGSIIVTAGCVVYGALTWNSSDEDENEDAKKGTGK